MMDSLLGYDPSFQQLALLDTGGQQLAQASRTAPSLSSQFMISSIEQQCNQSDFKRPTLCQLGFY